MKKRLKPQLPVWRDEQAISLLAHGNSTRAWRLPSFLYMCTYKKEKEYPTKAEIKPQAHVPAPNLKSSAAALAQQIQYSMYV